MPRSGLEVADVFRRYGEDYREHHGASLCTAQRRVMSAIELCRTAALGGHVERCDHCDHERICYNSCRNRHCPKCQSLARAQWLEDRRSELLDTQYFHVVFTVPQPIEVIALQNKESVYNILFRAASETLRTIAADPKHLGAQIGFFAVLHTWGQNLLHQPHLHCVVTCATSSPRSSPATRQAASTSCCPSRMPSRRPTGQRPDNIAYNDHTMFATLADCGIRKATPSRSAVRGMPRDHSYTKRAIPSANTMGSLTRRNAI
jgi:hypothetical protein